MSLQRPTRSGLDGVRLEGGRLPRSTNSKTLTFKPGRSGNPAGPPKGRPHKLTAIVRKMVDDKGGAVVAKLIERAEAGDADAARVFVRYLLPRPRLVTTPVDLPAVQTVSEAQAQIGMLVSMAARGALDLDALHALSQALHLAVSTRIEELEELLEEQEAQEPDDG